MTELTGRVAGIIWRAPDGGLVIARVTAPDAGYHTVVGPDQVPPLTVGLDYRFGGRMTRHPTHGEQFRFDGFAPLVAANRDGVTLYLRKLVDGVGPVTADRLWDAYGPDAVRVLREEPRRVADDGHLTIATASRASERLRANARDEGTRMDLVSLLAGRGFLADAVITAALARWGVRASDVIRRCPYRLLLAGIESCGWKRCDQLHRDLGHDPAALKRQALACEHVVSEAREGHTWHTAQSIGSRLPALVGPGADPVRAMRLAVRARRLAVERCGDERFVALAGEAGNEADVARHVRRMMAWMPTPPTSTTPPPPNDTMASVS